MRACDFCGTDDPGTGVENDAGTVTICEVCVKQACRMLSERQPANERLPLRTPVDA